MKFSQAFAATDNSIAVDHPLGATFHLLPYGHADAWERLQKKYSLAKLDKMSKVFTGEDVGDISHLAKHFDTLEEFQENIAAMAAAHVTAWTGLMEDDDKTPVEYSFEKVLQLATKHKPFLDWIDVNCKALADLSAKEDETEAVVKKN